MDTQTKHSGVVYLVEEQANPSTDYYILPLLKNKNKHVIRCYFKDIPVEESLKGADVIFIRYIPREWARLIEVNRHKISRLIYFMDDDLLDFHASFGMPLRYRYKLARLANFRKSWLINMRAQVWVSTAWLANKYHDLQPELVNPKPLTNVIDIRRIFYHGSLTHEAEIRWLKPVIEQVLERDSRLVFEIVGGSNVHSLFKRMPRVCVVHPMKWPAYQAFLTMPGRDIGLVPLLDIPFNKARSYTKFFDITRCGAVGIYSPDSCNEIVQHEHNGLVVDMSMELWVDAIVWLAGADGERARLKENAQLRVSDLAAQ